MVDFNLMTRRLRAYKLAQRIARLTLDSEETADYVDTGDIVNVLNSLIMDARNIVDGQPEVAAPVSKSFAVLGVYDDTGQVFHHIVTAQDAYEAMRRAAADMEGNNELCIIGAVEGTIKLVTPGDDNGSSCFAFDLTGGESA